MEDARCRMQDSSSFILHSPFSILAAYLQVAFDDPGNGCAEQIVSLPVEVDAVGDQEFIASRVHNDGEEIVDRAVEFSGNGCDGSVVGLYVGFEAVEGLVLVMPGVVDRCRRRPDNGGLCGVAESREYLADVGLILGEGDGARVTIEGCFDVVQAAVDVDDVRLACDNPRLQVLEDVLAVTAVFRWSPHLRQPIKLALNNALVAHTDGVADEDNAPHISFAAV